MAKQPEEFYAAVVLEAETDRQLGAALLQERNPHKLASWWADWGDKHLIRRFRTEQDYLEWAQGRVVARASGT